MSTAKIFSNEADISICVRELMPQIIHLQLLATYRQTADSKSTPVSLL